MTGDHDCSISRGSEICLGGLDHPLDVSTGRVVDEWIDAVPIRIAGIKNIRVRDGDGYIAVRMRATVIFEGKRGAIEGQSLLRRENFGRNRRSGGEGKLKSQSSTRWATRRCLRVFSWARMLTPSAF